MIHDSRLDWPPPLGAPVTMCCHLDAEPYDPTANHYDGYHGANVTVGVTWWDTWAEAIAYWRDVETRAQYVGSPEQVERMRADNAAVLDRLERQHVGT